MKVRVLKISETASNTMINHYINITKHHYQTHPEMVDKEVAFKPNPTLCLTFQVAFLEVKLLAQRSSVTNDGLLNQSLALRRTSLMEREEKEPGIT